MEWANCFRVTKNVLIGTAIMRKNKCTLSVKHCPHYRIGHISEHLICYEHFVWTSESRTSITCNVIHGNVRTTVLTVHSVFVNLDRWMNNHAHIEAHFFTIRCHFMPFVYQFATWFTVCPNILNLHYILHYLFANTFDSLVWTRLRIFW